MTQNVCCEFLDNVKRKQHQVWLTALLWFIGVIALIAIGAVFFPGTPFAAVQVAFYGSALIIYIPAISPYRLKCPYCHGSAGAVPIFRYKFMYCRACGQRIECKANPA